LGVRVLTVIPGTDVFPQLPSPLQTDLPPAMVNPGNLHADDVLRRSLNLVGGIEMLADYIGPVHRFMVHADLACRVWLPGGTRMVMR